MELMCVGKDNYRLFFVALSESWKSIKKFPDLSCELI